ncbi:solute carrier family 34 (sodium-dependent phosphate cotransporter) [Corynebacterium appendicis CIP 107643]|uniref:Solute carrier family 34 (Sodium-dependent phosphate cotransporter) n=1 Tax=Corynebacterium appendicis CIP 107643 TaxID=1161099 RepID=A0A1N7J8Q0_9CORY|nr:Na/Pi symporter [Corynebacterium appendicis]WJY61959.1 Na+/Pi-cotransporter [Corynebacterium appendicis CIP 107643]SIS45626.1 solute carrier family 34 (sodium-dependent phosphate cotransporter) [Corynebacterium appendicis CIP 107643]
MSDKRLPRDIAGEHDLSEGADVRVVDREVVDSEPIDVDGKARTNDTDANADADPDTDAEDNDPLSFLPLEGTAKQVVNWIAVFLGIWLLLNGVGMIGDGFNMAAGDQAKELFSFAENPFVGLAIGIVTTSIIQSSSTTTSIVVGMIAGGLPLDIAIPMLFGANMGTSVTSTLVALGLAGNRKQFHNGFSMATVHDFFNLIAISIFFTLEMVTGFLGKTATAIAPSLSGSGSGVISGIFESFGDFIDMITEPLVELASSLVEPFGDVWGGIVLAVVGVVLVLLSINFIGKILNALLVGKAQDILYAALGKNSFFGVLSGALITTLVQSSSTTTALTVPLAASGKFKVRTLFPFVVGANIGTTFTGLIAAFSASGAEAEAAMAGALVHTLFNLFSAILILIIPFLRDLPPKCSDWLATLAEKNKLYVFLYIGGVFFAIPLLAVFISNSLM